MKKMMIYAVIFALLLSWGTVFAAADAYLPPVSWIEGHYAGGGAESFRETGDVKIEWTPDFMSKVDLTDGNLSDWYAAGFAGTVITPNNMITWVDSGYGTAESGMPTDWKMTSFYAADSTYLYMGFDVVDASFAYAANDSSYDGDAIQLAIDFGGKLGEQIEQDPDVLINPRNIFYSFACREDGAPLTIWRQESDQDGPLCEENGDMVKGAARKTDEGWSVELALSWERMFEDYAWKTWDDGARIYVGMEEALPLKVGMSISYLNRTETSGEITWAAAAIREWLNEDGNPCISWTPYDNGMTLILPWQEGMDFDCDVIVIVNGFETAAPETEPAWEIPDVVTEAVPDESFARDEIWVETEWNTADYGDWEETLRDAAEDDTLDDELNAILEKYGCTAVIGTGSLTALLTLAAAAFVLKKK